MKIWVIFRSLFVALPLYFDVGEDLKEFVDVFVGDIFLGAGAQVDVPADGVRVEGAEGCRCINVQELLGGLECIFVINHVIIGGAYSGHVLLLLVAGGIVGSTVINVFFLQPWAGVLVTVIVLAFIFIHVHVAVIKLLIVWELVWHI